MSYYLPTGEFHEIDLTKRKEKNLIKTFWGNPDNVRRKYLLEGDIENQSKKHLKKFSNLSGQKPIR